MKRLKYRNAVRDAVFILVGCVVYAVGIALFLDPNGLTPAGVSGLAIVINHYLELWFGISGIETGTIIFIANIPIMALGIWKFGFKFFFTTIVATVMSSWFINLLEANVAPLSTDPLLCSILGGAFMSLGMGMIFRAGATTGGSDVIVRVLRTRFKHIKTGELFWAIDGVIIVLSAVAFRDIKVLLYAIITLAVQTFVIDTVLYGSDSATMVYIMSDCEDEIKRRILTELEAGVTLIKAEGAYTGKDKNVLLCVIKKQTFPKVKDLVAETDPTAFMIVTKATEIFGEGFKEHNADEI
ncbi:MAG: YitT family protein [Clostridia bacterium]|nr:YitT family protein [Clostridia bacterium]